LSLARFRPHLLLAIALALVLAMMAQPPIAQPQGYHHFADTRTLLGVPNFWNVLSNLPFLLVGLAGLAWASNNMRRVEAPLRAAWWILFAGVALVGLGSSWYHLAPGNATLVWDRLPMTLGFAGLVSAAIGERVDMRAGKRMLWPLLALGAFTVLYWYATERLGRGNVIPYGLYQGWSVLAIVLLLVLYPARRYTHGHVLVWAAVWYALAKIFETYDLAVFRLSGGWMSGHTIKHVLAAGAVFAILQGVRLRRRLPDPTLAPFT